MHLCFCEVLAWLSVWSKVQMICIWSRSCHCHPIISCSSKIQNGLPFWCWLTQVMLEQVLSSSWDGRPFGHSGHGPKIGGLCPFFGGSWVPILHNEAWTEAYLHAKWRLDPSSRLALPPFWGGGAGSLSNAMWPGPRPTCMPSFALIHPTVLPQYTNVIGQTTVR